MTVFVEDSPTYPMSCVGKLGKFFAGELVGDPPRQKICCKGPSSRLGPNPQDPDLGHSVASVLCAYKPAYRAAQARQ